MQRRVRTSNPADAQPPQAVLLGQGAATSTVGYWVSSTGRRTQPTRGCRGCPRDGLSPCPWL